jgi:hypothetical protein
MRIKTRTRSRLALLATLGLSGCLTEEPATTTEGAEIASVMGGMEWTIDAPWRLEPPFGAIPLTVAFHDGAAQYDSEIGQAKTLRRFCGVSIAQFAGTTNSDVHIQRKIPTWFHEIEAHAKWPYSSDVSRFHKLVRLWQGEYLGADMLDIDDRAEWYATVMYTPNVVAAGNDTYLHIHHIIWREHGGSNDPRNLICLCFAHHQAVHQRRISVTGTEPDGLVFDLSAFTLSAFTPLANVPAIAGSSTS